jgi:hypothetical protein
VIALHTRVSAWFKTYVFTPILKALTHVWGTPKNQAYLGILAFSDTFFIIGSRGSSDDGRTFPPQVRFADRLFHAARAFVADEELSRDLHAGGA